MVQDVVPHVGRVPGPLHRDGIALHLVQRQQREERRRNLEGSETDVLLVDAVLLPLRSKVQSPFSNLLGE
jgi:hypothetical protein